MMAMSDNEIRELLRDYVAEHEEDATFSWDGLKEIYAKRLAPMTGEEMVRMLILFDEMVWETGAPDSDFVEALAYDVRTDPKEIDRFWKYLAMGDCDAEWDD